MARRVALAAAALLALSVTHGWAQTAPPGGDPSRRLAQSLALQVRAVLEARREPIALLVVAPVGDPTGKVTGGAKRAHTALLLELAKLPSTRLSTADPRAAPEDAWALVTTLDVTREAAILTGRLETSADGAAAASFLAALPASPSVIAALGRASGTPGKVSVRFAPAGEVEAAVRAAASAQLRGDSADELAVVGDSATRILAFENGLFHESVSVSHPRADGAGTAAPARDPRAGVVALPRGTEAVDLWVRGPRGPAYTWRGDSGAVSVVRRADDVPLAAWPTGGVLLGGLVRGTNEFERLSIAASPQDPARDLDGRGAVRVLEATVGDGWLATEDRSGEVALEPTARLGERVSVGRFGSAVAVIDGHGDDGAWILGDRDDGATLVLSRAAAGDVDEVWRGPAPFRLCALVPGHFDGKDRRELVAVGCESRASLALVTIEVEP